MNDVPFDYLDAFVVVYIDDIVVYSQLLTEHERHLRMVFQWLREHILYVKTKKMWVFSREYHIFGTQDQCRLDQDEWRQGTGYQGVANS